VPVTRLANPDMTADDFYRVNKRILTFDTSVDNWLVKIGSSANPIYSVVESQYFFRLAGLSFEEMMVYSSFQNRAPSRANQGPLLWPVVL
jgi:hypothetical protein